MKLYIVSTKTGVSHLCGTLVAVSKIKKKLEERGLKTSTKSYDLTDDYWLIVPM